MTNHPGTEIPGVLFVQISPRKCNVFLCVYLQAKDIKCNCGTMVPFWYLIGYQAQTRTRNSTCFFFTVQWFWSNGLQEVVTPSIN